MSTAVCTLFEGDYHYGVGALVNSLYRHGFRGVVWAGYRGELPQWAAPLVQGEGYQELRVGAAGEACLVRFVPLDTDVHFTNYKPTFMLRLWDEFCPDTASLFYFDPDIVVKCRWKFYEEWIERGMALVQDVNNIMPANHPVRGYWMDMAREQGLTVARELNYFFNGGFIGVQKQQSEFLQIWQGLIANLGNYGVDVAGMWGTSDRSYPIVSTDQDTMNIAAMVTSFPLSTVGPEGMDFVHGGFTMSHAIMHPKPWAKNFLKTALKGRSPSMADKQFWMNVSEPIALYSPAQRRRVEASLKSASALGRVWKRR